jgi:hypothetical protein
MNSRQRFAYEHPLWTKNPWSLEPEYQQRITLGDLTICTIVRMHGSYHGERPDWHSSVGPVNAAGDYLRLADLTVEQRESLRALGQELLQGVGIEPCLVIEGERTFEIFKDLCGEELEGLPLEIRETRPAVRKVTSREACPNDFIN